VRLRIHIRCASQYRRTYRYPCEPLYPIHSLHEYAPMTELAKPRQTGDAAAKLSQPRTSRLKT
jgi:hypothetical protein